MAFVSDNGTWEHDPVSTIMLTVIVSAFSILVAFSIRDVITQLINKVHDRYQNYKLAISVLLTSLFIFILVWLSYNYGDQIKK